MSIITRQDTNGVKSLLLTGELGYDNYPAGGDKGRVFVGTGTENIGLAKKTEVVAVDTKADTHIARTDNPHAVTKAQVGLGNVDNTADVDKNVLSATKLTAARSISLSGDIVGTVNFDGSTNVNITTTVQPNSVTLGTDTVGNYTSGITAGSGITVTGIAGEGWNPTIAITSVGTAGTYTKITTNDKGQVTAGTTLVASDIPSLDASKITSGIIDAARLPAYVDDVLEYANLSAFPVVGETGKIYVALDTNKAYRWSGSIYVYITSGAVDSVAGKTGVVTLTKSDVGLSNVDNTSDLNKPISTATQSALDLKANAANAVFTGIPTAPTAAVGTNTTQLATTAYVNAEIANDTYSKTQLNNGQLDNRYFTETELLNGALDTRYYTETEIDAKLASQNDASEINVTPIGSLTSTNVQAALVELQGDVDNRYTKAEVDVKLAEQNDASEISYDGTLSELVATNVQDAIDEVENRLDVVEGVVAETNLTRADKYLAAQSVVKMIYNPAGKLSKVRYNNDTDVDYEVLTYNGIGKLSNVAHYVEGVLMGNTTLSYENGKLVSAPYIAV